jgi:hypothetical protein
VRDNDDSPKPSSFSRRTFVGLILGTVGSFLAACRSASNVPALPATAPLEAAVSPTATSGPAKVTSVPLGVTHSSPTSSSTASPLPPTASPTSPPPSDTPPSLSPSAPTATDLPPTYTPVPATPTSPPLPTATPTVRPNEPPVLNRATLMAHWPVTQVSRVVLVRHDGVWSGSGVADPGIVSQMLDAGLSTLTDVPDALAVWRVLFEPGERVLLKVNCIAYGGPTQPIVAYTVAQRLIDAGLPGENVLIFDRTDNELASSGYSLNEGGPGVRCHGSRGVGTEISLSQARVRFFREFDEVDAIVNLPTPKQHSGAGVSVAMKNHYGSVDRPGALHGALCDPAIAELNAQPNIQAKTRLIVGAALNVSPGDWNRPERENALLLSFDPVAHDTVARDILVRHRQAMGLSTRPLVEGARHLQTAQSLGLGATDAGLIDLREVTLG